MKIGVVAPSFGIYNEDGIKKFNAAKTYFESQGHEVIYNDLNQKLPYASDTAENRAKDFLDIYKKSDLIISIAGGEVMLEMLEYLDFDYIKENKKIFMGYSDNTNLTFTLTTNFNFVTIYGLHFSTFGRMHDRVIKNFLDLLFNNENHFVGFDKIEEIEHIDPLLGFNLTKDNKWKYTLNNKLEGILLGGCLDCILSLVSTKFDNTLEYIKDKDIIWYFDLYDINIFDLKRALIQFSLNGYFKTCKGIIISRLIKPDDMFGISLRDILLEFSNKTNINIIYDADLGHIAPVIPFINGLHAKIQINDGIGEITYDKGKIEALTR